MEEIFSVKNCEKNKNYLTIHPIIAKKFNVMLNQQVTLKFGVQIAVIIITISKDIEPNMLQISNNIVNLLKLPLYLNYLLTSKDGILVIGPFIGILAARTNKLLHRRLPDLLNYANDYSRINGCIVTFSLAQINYQEKIIHGYIYNPSTTSWEEGTFNYPAVMLVRTMINTKKRKQLQTATGSQIINNAVYNKWQCFKLLSPLKEFLPATSLYETSGQIFDYLHRYQSVFIKPISSLGGRKIKKIISNKQGEITIISQRKGRTSVETFEHYREAASYFQKSLNKNKWLIQEPIQLLTFKQSVIDFRCIIVKGADGNWRDLGLIGRYGKKGSIVSNVSSGGKAEIGSKTIKKMLNFSEEDIVNKRKEMTNLAIGALKILEETEDVLGTAGVDIGIDEQGKLWLIEVNLCNPAHDIALDAGNHELYRKIVTTIMLYLKFENGFQTSKEVNEDGDTDAPIIDK